MNPKKTKSFILFEECGIRIKCSVNRNGGMVHRNNFVFLTWEREYKTQYAINNKEKLYIQGKLYRKENKKVLAIKSHDYYIENSDHIKEKSQRYRKDNKEKCKVRDALYYQKNKIKIAKHNKKYYKDNCEHIKDYVKQWAIDNKEHCKTYRQQYYQTHREQHRAASIKTQAKRRLWGRPVILNEWFEGAHLHHLHEYGDRTLCMYIPAEIHRSVGHAYTNINTMKIINILAWNWYDSQPERFFDCDESCDAYHDDMLIEEYYEDESI